MAYLPLAAGFDWDQIITIIVTPDNIPIVAMLFLIPFYVWYGMREARRNDRLIAKLESGELDPKTHHRKYQPYKKGWDKTVHVWPYLLRIEFLAALVVTVILIVWSITLNAPLEEPANPNLTMNPAKAPWYFLGLQEMLVYFDPWIAGVVLPSVILVGLMAIPYIDVNPLGNGYYTIKQRRFSYWTFMFGFLALWLMLIIIGTFIRGPGWMWFWPGETWDHHRVIHELNRDLDHVIFGPDIGIVFRTIVGFIFVSIAAMAVQGGFHKWFRKFKPDTYARMNIWQYAVLQLLVLHMALLPGKMFLRLAFRIKYIWVTPWFNV